MKHRREMTNGWEYATEAAIKPLLLWSQIQYIIEQRSTLAFDKAGVILLKSVVVNTLLGATK